MLARRELLLSMAAVTLRAAPRKPNVLLVAPSGWRGVDAPDSITPHLVNLAEQGITYSRCYTAGPSGAIGQAALLSGNFPHALHPDQPLVASAFRNAGYHTALQGDWSLNRATIAKRGFDQWAAAAADYLEQFKTNPFFMAISWDVAGLGSQVDPDASAKAARVRGNVPEGREADSMREVAVANAGRAAIDQRLGAMLAALDQLHLAGDTIVVFTSDGGDMLGSHGLEGRGQPFEECVRVPLVLRYPPAIRPGGVSDALVSTAGIAPSLGRMCDLDLGELAPQGGPLSERAEFVCSEGQLGGAGEWRALVRGLDKIVVDRNLEVTNLYNLGADPLETQSLAADPAHELKRDELKALLRQWMRRTEDRMDASGLKRR